MLLPTRVKRTGEIFLAARIDGGGLDPELSPLRPTGLYWGHLLGASAAQLRQIDPRESKWIEFWGYELEEDIGQFSINLVPSERPASISREDSTIGSYPVLCIGEGYVAQLVKSLSSWAVDNRVLFIQVSSGLLAWHYLWDAQLLPKLILLDLDLPSNKQLDCLQEILDAAKANRIPVIVYSAGESRLLSKDQQQAALTAHQRNLCELIGTASRLPQ